MAHVLNGITWGHSRGITPLLAASQRYQEMFPDVEIRWKKRTLQEFADFPIEKLTDTYDLLIIDHPWVGTAAHTGCVLPLDEYLPETFLQEQEVLSTGASHKSYHYNGHQWALAIDAATPVSSFRGDLLQLHHEPVPAKWEQILQLAKAGKLALPAIPIDALMNFYMFCIAVGETPFEQEAFIVSPEKGVEALELMRELYALLPEEMFHLNPIGVAERMSGGNDYWYCPFAYGYSNYSRNGYAKYRLDYGDLPTFRGSPFRSTLGGTGLAVSAASAYKEEAVRFARMVASPEWQCGLYVENGGQPGLRAAWTHETYNALTGNYFSNTLPALERAFVRPRHHGYLDFQDEAGYPLQEFLRYGGSARTTLEKLEHLYRKSFQESSLMERYE